MSTERPDARDLPAHDQDPEVEYHPLGPNHSLRINGVAYFYEPAEDRWLRGSVTMEQVDYAYSFSAEDILYGMADGSLHVAVWVVRS